MPLHVSQLPFETELSGSLLGAGHAGAKLDDGIEPMRILLIDHGSIQCNSFSEELRRNGFFIDTATGDDATANAALATNYALILLDSMRPGFVGSSAVEAIRRKSDVPLLVMTERDSVAARMAGLELGASDYLVKPFSASELLGRVKTLARRPGQRLQRVLRLGDLELDERTMWCSRDGVEIYLTRMEFALLLLLLQKQGQVLSRQLLERQIWNREFDRKNNAVDVAVRRLRSKLDEPFQTRLLHTVRGEGYVLEEHPCA